MADIGLGEIEHSCDWAAELGDSTVQPHTNIGHDNGYLTAVNEEWDLTRNELLINERLKDAGRSHFATTLPEKILVTEADTPTATIELWNIRAVLKASGVTRRSRSLRRCTTVLLMRGQTRIAAGDFNSPGAEISRKAEIC